MNRQKVKCYNVNLKLVECNSYICNIICNHFVLYEQTLNAVTVFKGNNILNT